MSEYAESLGRRVQLQRRRLNLENECKALRDQLRRALPVDADIAELDCSSILQSAVSLEQKAQEIAEIDRRLAALAQIIGM